MGKKLPCVDKGVDAKEIASHDPSPTKKYTVWMSKQLAAGANPNDVYPTVAYFHRHVAKFERKDINAYRTVSDLEDAVKDVDARLGSAGGENAPAKIIAEEGHLTLEWLETKQDAWRYTNSSRWCITQRSASYFESYSSENTSFYVIRDRSKSAKSMSEGFAYAISIQRDVDDKLLQTDVWNQNDKTISLTSKRLSDAHRKLVNVAIEDSKMRPKSVLARLNYERRGVGAKTVSDQEIKELLRTHTKFHELQVIVPLLPMRYAARFCKHEDARLRCLAVRCVNVFHYADMMDDESADVRAEIAERLDHESLPLMMNDRSQFVRNAVARRIHRVYLPRMMNDRSVCVRVVVAERIESVHLPHMLNDKSASVRMLVARRVDPSLLHQMMDDESWQVRRVVAERIDPSCLPRMLNDESPLVRCKVAERIALSYLPKMMKDKDAHVRLQVANRIEPSYLQRMLNDPCEVVRVIARRRLNWLVIDH